MTAGRRRAYRRGRLAEAVSAWWLRLKGYRILARGYRTPVGEIDLVARRGDVLAIVEVKARPDIGTAAAALGSRQRHRIGRAAALYRARHPDCADLAIRFDAVLVRPWRPPVHVIDAWRPASDRGI